MTDKNQSIQRFRTTFVSKSGWSTYTKNNRFLFISEGKYFTETLDQFQKQFWHSTQTEPFYHEGQKSINSKIHKDYWYVNKDGQLIFRKIVFSLVNLY